ncbi:hypothetical protein ABPG74_014969 [Tetrahymena malaccensis]
MIGERVIVIMQQTCKNCSHVNYTSQEQNQEKNSFIIRDIFIKHNLKFKQENYLKNNQYNCAQQIFEIQDKVHLVSSFFATNNVKKSQLKKVQHTELKRFFICDCKNNGYNFIKAINNQEGTKISKIMQATQLKCQKCLRYANNRKQK